LKAGQLEAIDEKHHVLPAAFWGERSSDPPTWSTVRFRREDVLRLWPSGPDLWAILERAIKDKGMMLTGTEAVEFARGPRN
jgi:hypothetical protein